nr:rod-binding protein [uncultured Gellertiella sp.]
MSITPSSDLVMDVVRAADPAQVQLAQEKLKANRAAFRANSVADAGAGFGVTLAQANSAAFDAGLSHAGHTKIKASEIPKAYRDYEAVFMQNFVKSMMPQDSEDVYGKGIAGDMWKGMEAEQLGKAISDGGGVGIAEQMFAQQLAHKAAHSNVQASADDKDKQAALSVVTDLQRRTFGVSSPENDKSSRE